MATRNPAEKIIDDGAVVTYGSAYTPHFIGDIKAHFVAAAAALLDLVPQAARSRAV